MINLIRDLIIARHIWFILAEQWSAALILYSNWDGDEGSSDDNDDDGDDENNAGDSYWNDGGDLEVDDDDGDADR